MDDVSRHSCLRQREYGRSACCCAARFWHARVGRIFEAFRDGELEDDDEVAVVHGPAGLGHIQISEAMVNMRAT